MATAKHLTGHLVRFLYQNDHGWGIALFKSPDETAQVKIKGNVGFLQPKLTYELTGKFEEHPKYGRSFEVNSFQVVDLKTNDQYRDFFKTMVAGVGAVTAQRIIDVYQSEDLFTEILAHPERLDFVRGLSEGTKKELLEKIREVIQENRFTAAFFQGNLKMDFLIHLKNHFARAENADEQIAMTLETNFYRYAKIHHLGPFEEVDKVAVHFGQLREDDLTRLAWNLNYLANEIFSQTGDTYTSKKALFWKLSTVRGIFSETLLEAALDKALELKLLVKQQKAYFSDDSWNDEATIALEITQRLKRKNSLISDQKLDKLIDEIEIELANDLHLETFTYDQSQRIALKTFANAEIYLLNGGPGTGKTTVLKGIVRLFEKLEKRSHIQIAIATPTGRAASRINEIDPHLKAKTIHRLLQATENGDFEIGPTNPLEIDLVVIDEASMIENKLFARLLEATILAKKIVFIGDENQLPSVGYGDVFANLLQFKPIPQASLKTIHRQKEGNGIIKLAYRILNHEVHDATDFELANIKTDFKTTDSVNLVAEIFKAKMNEEPNPLQFQVITSFYKGSAGINAFNSRLQKTYQEEILKKNFSNEKQAFIRGTHLFYPQDKVMYLTNDSALGLSNGDLGIIKSLNFKNEKFETGMVAFNQETKQLTGDNFQNLILSYGCSVHKTQGSEYQSVIFVVEPGMNSFFLNRKLIYTAITRAKKELYLIADLPTLLAGIDREPPVRKTCLVARMNYFLQKKLRYNEPRLE